MKFLPSLVFVLLSGLATASPLPNPESLPESLADPILEARQSPVPVGVDVKMVTDRLLFSTPMSTFLTALNGKNPPYISWPEQSSKACSTPTGDYPFGFNFHQACLRHDFGYANYRIQKRLCRAGELAVDALFSRDLNHYCRGLSWWKRPLCYTTANTYSLFVDRYTPAYSQGC